VKNAKDKPLNPGSTATGSGTSMGEESAQNFLHGEGHHEEEHLENIGTTEADVSDGREQKQPRVD
jgi:hypothetical protein